MKQRKVLLVWVAVIAAILLAVGLGAWISQRNAVPDNAQTVAEAVNGGVQQEGPATAGDAYRSERVSKLAEALGIPVEAMPRGVVVDKEDTARQRSDLVKLLNAAVSEGKMTHQEAQTILRAFEMGIVTPAVDAIYVESAPVQ